jgi:hypothetical protein
MTVGGDECHLLGGLSRLLARHSIHPSVPLRATLVNVLEECHALVLIKRFVVSGRDIRPREWLRDCSVAPSVESAARLELFRHQRLGQPDILILKPALDACLAVRRPV